MTTRLKFIESLFNLADMWEENDPIGAANVRRAARMLAENRCMHCEVRYKDGYARGYNTGYITGSREWQKGLERECAGGGAPRQ